MTGMESYLESTVESNPSCSDMSAIDPEKCEGKILYWHQGAVLRIILTGCTMSSEKARQNRASYKVQAAVS